MKKLLSICMILMLLISACAFGETQYPLTLQDQAGRSVIIGVEPMRIVSGYYISTSAIIALDAQNKMVGIEAKADKRNIYWLAAPELIQLPSVGSAKEFDLEGCLALNPDLVILPQKLKDAAETISQLGIPVLLVNPENQELLCDMIGMLGSALNCESRADALLSDLNDKEAWLDDHLADADRPTVYIASNSALLSTAGSGMYQSDLIRRAGGGNAATELTDDYWQNISYEQLLTWDPDVILLASDASYFVQDVLDDPNLSELKAVQNGCVYQMPDAYEAWDSPVPGGMLGAAWLASRIHGDIVSKDAFNKMVKQFYGTYYSCFESEIE